MWIICFQPQKGKYRVSLQKECHDLAVGKMHVRRSSVQASCTQCVQINSEDTFLIANYPLLGIAL